MQAIGVALLQLPDINVNVIHISQLRIPNEAIFCQPIPIKGQKGLLVVFNLLVSLESIDNPRDLCGLTKIVSEICHGRLGQLLDSLV